MTPTEQQNAALAAFVACVVAKLNPSLVADTEPHNGEGEYAVLIGGRGMAGILHEDIETVPSIATEHGGRAFLTNRLQGHDDPERPLCIVWPAPADPLDPATPAKQRKAKARR